MFDHIYCINLESRPDRWEQCQEEFEKHNIIGVERLNATTAEEMQRIHPNLPVKYGEAALIDSHRRALIDSKKNNYKSILILEDDVEFASTIHQSLDHIPTNWDIVYFGGNHAWGRPTPINEFVGIANKTLAMHAVGIKDAVIDRMLEEINLSAPIDVTYAYRLYLYNSYVMFPSQAWQRPGWSDLMGQNVDYGFLK